MRYSTVASHGVEICGRSSAWILESVFDSDNRSPNFDVGDILPKYISILIKRLPQQPLLQPGFSWIEPIYISAFQLLGAVYASAQICIIVESFRTPANSPPEVFTASWNFLGQFPVTFGSRHMGSGHVLKISRISTE